MEKKSVNRGLMFLLVFLVVVGVFLLYSRLTFTGYVTKIVNATTGETISTTNFSGGGSIKSGTEVLNGNVVLEPEEIEGGYTSRIFDAGQDAVWMNFASNYSIANDSTNSIVFKVRTCSNNCSNEDFNVFNGDLNLIGRYFQYRVEMSRVNTSVESPVLFEVSVSYYLPMSLPIVIESPQSITYNNETAVPINISTNTSNATILFSYDGGVNETYNGTVINQMFTPGTHTLTAWITYVEGNITHENSSSVTFSVESKQTFYKIINGTCTAEDIFPSQKTANDYNTLAECQSHITNATTSSTTTTESQPEKCSPKWECFYNDTAAWSECVDGVQTRTCTDTSGCTGVTDTSTMPPETQTCEGGITTSATAPTEEEKGVVSEQPTSKGFFSFVGSAIVGPIFKSKIGLTFVILLVLVIGGLLVYKFLLKDKLKLKFFGKKKFLFFH